MKHEDTHIMMLARALRHNRRVLSDTRDSREYISIDIPTAALAQQLAQRGLAIDDVVAPTLVRTAQRVLDLHARTRSLAKQLITLHYLTDTPICALVADRADRRDVDHVKLRSIINDLLATKCCCAG